MQGSQILVNKFKNLSRRTLSPLKTAKRLVKRFMNTPRYLSILGNENKQLRALLTAAEEDINKWREIHKKAQEDINIFQTELLTWQNLANTPTLTQDTTSLEHALTYQTELAELHAQTISLLIQSNFVNNLQHTPLVSIIMPVWNRAEMVKKAIASITEQIYTNWELIIVNDGSTDNTHATIQTYLKDPRIRYYLEAHQGASSARNTGLAHSKGELIAYLDSDNFWLPHVLALLVYAYNNDPEIQGFYFAESWHDQSNHKRWLYFPNHIHSEIATQVNELTGIELNSFTHTREAYERLGGFDTNLTRLIDYELTYRYAQQVPIKALPFLGTHYHYRLATNSITNIENCWYNYYRIRSKHQSAQKGTALRVLYLLDHYPQLTESYIYTEIDFMQKQGVHIEVWAEFQPASPFPTTVPIHYGSLDDAIRLVAPELVHAHWLTALRFVDTVAKHHLQMTVRSHGFDFYDERLRNLHASDAVYAIYLFPHVFKNFGPEFYKLRSVPVCFNPDRYYPNKDKNKKMVLRVSSALPAKDLMLFFRTAELCKEHHFVLVVGRCRNDRFPHYAEELVEYNKSRGNPVELHINMLPDEIAGLVREAAIYLHTHSLPGDEYWTPYGMSISISESMATGAYVLGRDYSPIADFIGSAGDCYTDAESCASLINATLNWSDEKWYQCQQHAIDRAYQHFADNRVLPTIFKDWLTIQFQREVNQRLQTACVL